MKSIKSLIFADAAINLGLGVLLILFPDSVVTFLGLPPADPAFYPSLLGAVLFGIGIALLIGHRGQGGLGLNGAIAINLSGGVVLACWLLFGDLALPPRGTALLWLFVLILVGISAFEALAQSRHKTS